MNAGCSMSRPSGWARKAQDQQGWPPDTLVAKFSTSEGCCLETCAPGLPRQWDACPLVQAAWKRKEEDGVTMAQTGRAPTGSPRSWNQAPHHGSCNVQAERLCVQFVEVKQTVKMSGLQITVLVVSCGALVDRKLCLCQTPWVELVQTCVPYYRLWVQYHVRQPSGRHTQLTQAQPMPRICKLTTVLQPVTTRWPW